MNNFKYILCLLVWVYSFPINLSAQTKLIKDINPKKAWSNFKLIHQQEGQLFFTAIGAEGKELFQSDGTSEGTKLFFDINVGIESADPDLFLELNGTWFFVANDGSHGFELWKTDWTIAGTKLVKDINPNFNSSSPSEFLIHNNKLFFAADDGTNGKELWQSDGTAAGTKLVKDIHVGEQSSFPKELVSMGNTLVFSAVDSDHGRELWKSNGTAPTTSLLKDIRANEAGSFPTQLTFVEQRVYFVADDGQSGIELWLTDGTTDGTYMLADINSGVGSSSPSDLFVNNSTLYFTADNAEYGLELYSVFDIENPTIVLHDIHEGKDSSLASDFMVFKGSVFFNANNGRNGFELWKTEGASFSTALVKDVFPSYNSSAPVMLGATEDYLYFYANDGAHGFELWRTDGTTAGTTLLKDINPYSAGGDGNSFPTNPVVVDNVLYFSAFHEGKAWQIYKTTDDDLGVVMVTDIPQELVFEGLYIPFFVNNIADTTLFVAFSDEYGEEFWRYEPVPLILDSIKSNSPLLCYGDSTGAINVHIGSGIGAANYYNYQWNNEIATGANPQNLPAGNYIVTITDCGGNKINTSITIEQPTKLNIDVVNTKITEAVCLEGGDGRIELAVIGGMPTYSYLWDSGDTTKNISKLSIGVYTVIVTDAHDCKLPFSFPIRGPNLEAIFLDSTICYDSPTGSAMASVDGDTLAYDFLWDNGEMGAIASMLSLGVHHVVITDSLACKDSVEVNILSPDSLSATFVITNPNIDSTNGMLTVTVEGGTPPYQYLWSTDSLQTSHIATGLALGTYMVTVTDSHDCTTIFSVTIDESVATNNIDELEKFSVFPNPANEYVLLNFSFKKEITSHLRLLDYTGKEIRTWNFNSKKELLNINVSDLTNGIYLVQLHLPKGVVSKKIVIIGE